MTYTENDIARIRVQARTEALAELSAAVGEVPYIYRSGPQLDAEVVTLNRVLRLIHDLSVSRVNVPEPPATDR